MKKFLKNENGSLSLYTLMAMLIILTILLGIYIYNSHQLENYDSTNLDIYGITPNVMMASYLLKEKLNKKGLSTIPVKFNTANEFFNAMENEIKDNVKNLFFCC